MKIHNVQCHNWKPPGGPWWRDVEAKPDAPLIEATIRMTLSWNEYIELLDRAKATDEICGAEHVNPFVVCILPKGHEGNHSGHHPASQWM